MINGHYQCGDIATIWRAGQCSNARTNTSHLVNSSYLSHLGTKGQVSCGSNQGHQRWGG